MNDIKETPPPEKPIKEKKISKSKHMKDNQIFKTPVSVTLLWSFLQENFEESETHIQINKFLYKKTEYNQRLTTFIAALKPHYHNSKRKYIDRQMTYNYFLTIIRQLCNSHKIPYTTKLVYDKSSYEIEYTVQK